MTMNFSDSRVQIGALVIVAAGAAFWTRANPAPVDVAVAQHKADAEMTTRLEREQLRTNKELSQAQLQTAKERAAEVLDRINVCTIAVLENQPWVSPALSEGQGAVGFDSVSLNGGFVCTTTHTAKVVNGKVTDVIPVSPDYMEEYTNRLNILLAASEQRFQDSQPINASDWPTTTTQGGY
jgi:hypothetical protein